MRTGGSPSLAFLLGFTLLPAPSIASPAKESKNQPQPVSFIAGTIYRPPGFSMPGVEITLLPEQKESGETKFRKQSALTDARGEFVFRVPAVPMKYTVTVQVKGFVPQTRTVEIEHQQHREIPFTLQPESRKE